MTRRSRRALGLAMGALAVLAACRATVVPDEKTCSGAQALGGKALRGGSLPMKTVALTFDDGPGARTSELSTYLAQQAVKAAFFINGRMVGTTTALLAQLVADGHVLANHTQTHRSLTGRSTGTEHLSEAETIAELQQTDAIIVPFVAHDRFMFRPPFGDFDAESLAFINSSPMKKYVGPIDWDIGDHMGENRAADWDCWRPGDDGVVLSPADCAALYLREIESAGKGIVLLHDPYFIDDDPTKGGTVDLVKVLVPALKERGFSFQRVDLVPEIAALLPPLQTSGDSSAGGATSTSSSGEVDSSSSGNASGGNPDPCPPSPQPKPANTGESGNLRGR